MDSDATEFTTLNDIIEFYYNGTFLIKLELYLIFYFILDLYYMSGYYGYNWYGIFRKNS